MLNDTQSRNWLQKLGFDTESSLTFNEFPDYIGVDGQHREQTDLYVEVEWSGGCSPEHNVLKYWPFITQGCINQMRLIHVIMPTFYSYPTSIYLAQFLGRRMQESLGERFQYKFIDLRETEELKRRQGETDKEHKQRLEDNLEQLLVRFSEALQNEIEV